MKRAAAIPREVSRSCSGGCGCKIRTLNGSHFKAQRERAEVTLAELAAICGRSVSQLSLMERGYRVFSAEIAKLYDSLFDRRRRTGYEPM